MKDHLELIIVMMKKIKIIKTTYSTKPASWVELCGPSACPGSASYLSSSPPFFFVFHSKQNKKKITVSRDSSR